MRGHSWVCFSLVAQGPGGICLGIPLQNVQHRTSTILLGRQRVLAFSWERKVGPQLLPV